MEEDVILGEEHVFVNVYVKDTDGYAELMENNLLLLADTTQDEETKELYELRSLKNQIQNLRKKANLHVWDKVDFYFQSEDEKVNNILTKYHEKLLKETNCYVMPMTQKNSEQQSLLQDDLVVKRYVNVQMCSPDDKKNNAVNAVNGVVKVIDDVVDDIVDGLVKDVVNEVAGVVSSLVDEIVNKSKKGSNSPSSSSQT